MLKTGEKSGSEMTQYPLGAAFVLGKEKPNGVITEGDIRRALNNSCEIDKTTAEEIMSTDPKQISPEENLGTALEIMEKGDTKISVLPVLRSEDQVLVGMIRLHDIFS